MINGKLIKVVAWLTGNRWSRSTYLLWIRPG